MAAEARRTAVLEALKKEREEARAVAGTSSHEASEEDFAKRRAERNALVQKLLSERQALSVATRTTAWDARIVCLRAACGHD